MPPGRSTVSSGAKALQTSKGAWAEVAGMRQRRRTAATAAARLFNQPQGVWAPVAGAPGRAVTRGRAPQFPASLAPRWPAAPRAAGRGRAPPLSGRARSARPTQVGTRGLILRCPRSAGAADKYVDTSAPDFAPHTHAQRPPVLSLLSLGDAPVLRPPNRAHAIDAMPIHGQLESRPSVNRRPCTLASPSAVPPTPCLAYSRARSAS
jgi:hypothetical protein